MFDVSSAFVLTSPRPHLAQKTMPSRLTVRQLAQIILDSSQGLVAACERGVAVEGFQGQGARVVLVAAQAHDEDGDVVGAAPLVGQGDEPVRRDLWGKLADQQRDLLIRGYSPQAVRTQHQCVAWKKLFARIGSDFEVR